MHDQDSNDCVALKNELIELARTTENAVPFVIRIACRELENWYLGDVKSIKEIYQEVSVNELRGKAKYRNPDNVFGAYELGLLTDNFSKTGVARAIGPIISLESNLSPSFQQFLKGISKLIST